MNPASKMDEIKSATNSPQRIVIAVTVPVLALVLGYGLIHLIGNGMRGEYWRHDCTPLDLIQTWWMWAIVLLAIATFEFLWLRDKA